MAFAAERFLIKTLFRNSVFRTTFETTDNQIIQRSMAFAATGLSLKFEPGYSIFGTAG